MVIYKVENDSKNRKFTKLTQTSLTEMKISELDLENILFNDISPLSEALFENGENKLKVITKEFNGFEGSNKRLDLLCLDADNNLVVVELKRADSAHMELQALRYAAFMSGATFSQVCDIYKKDDGRDCKEILDFLAEEDTATAAANFNKNMYIVLVAENFSKEVISTVLWLGSFGIKISCVKMSYCKDENSNVVVSFEKVIPLKETEEYMMRIAEKEAEEKQAKASSKDYSKYQVDGIDGIYNKRKLVLNIVKDYISKNPEISASALGNKFPSRLQSISSKGDSKFGVFKKLSEIDEADKERFFTDSPLNIKEGEILVSNQWGKENIGNFITAAEKLGYKIEKIA